jgi:hypothetical protein
MVKSTLFLLKPGFHDDKNKPYFYPNCATVKGFLKYTPQIESKLEVQDRISAAPPGRHRFGRSGKSGVSGVGARRRRGRPCRGQEEPGDWKSVYLRQPADLRLSGPYVRGGPASPLRMLQGVKFLLLVQFSLFFSSGWMQPRQLYSRRSPCSAKNPDKPLVAAEGLQDMNDSSCTFGITGRLLMDGMITFCFELPALELSVVKIDFVHDFIPMI